jgi:hypothetical protein
VDIDKHQPHVFVDMDLMPFSPPLVPRGVGSSFNPPPIPGGKSKLCGICHGPKSDRVHIEGEAEADAESPKWG